MNKSEYYSSKDRYNSCYKQIQKLLKDWKINNNYACKCVVHHRDDTEEVREYNASHYERWGFEADGTFEYGKYVVFMTNAEHNSYHHAGKTISNETKQKMSKARKGHTFSEEHRTKISEALTGIPHDEARKRKLAYAREVYSQYKASGGLLKWNDFRKTFKDFLNESSISIL